MVPWLLYLPLFNANPCERLRLHALGQQSRVKLVERSRATTGPGGRTLEDLFHLRVVVPIDLTRVMNRLKALYRGWGIPCAGTRVYAPRYREEWLNKLPQAGVRRRAELLYQQLDGLQALRREVRPELLAESRTHKAAKLLRHIPCIGPIRAARLIALMQTPHRFRSKR